MTTAPICARSSNNVAGEEDVTSEDETQPPSARQIALGFAPPPPRLARADFVMTESNARALEALDGWLASNETALAISGPPASGKTHLAAIAAAALGCGITNAEAIGEIHLEGAATMVVDAAERAFSADALFDLIEGARVAGTRLVIAGRGRPADWAHGLSDLSTRLSAMPLIGTAEPDEDLLAAVIDKLLRDRQLRISQSIGRYAAPRLPRTFAAAQGFVGALDAAAAEKKAPVSLKLAREVLDNLSEEPFRA